MAKAKARKNNDGISYSGFQWDRNLLHGIAEASRHHGSNWAEVEVARDYFDRHPEEKLRFVMGQIRITAKSASKILKGVMNRARLERTSDERGCQSSESPPGRWRV
jgi:hypothetical protein